MRVTVPAPPLPSTALDVTVTPLPTSKALDAGVVSVPDSDKPVAGPIVTLPLAATEAVSEMEAAAFDVTTPFSVPEPTVIPAATPPPVCVRLAEAEVAVAALSVKTKRPLTLTVPP